MSKKWWLITGGSIATVIGGLAVTVFMVSQIGKSTTPATSQAKVPETFSNAKPTTDAVYTDTSGFSFKYPKDVSVADTTPNDQTYYTQLTLKRQANIILISARDSAVEQTYANLVGAVTLGGLSAKQYGTGDRLITVAYDRGVLYTVDAPAHDIYLSQVYDTIISTFYFGIGSTPMDPNAVYEEETVE